MGTEVARERGGGLEAGLGTSREKKGLGTPQPFCCWPHVRSLSPHNRPPPSLSLLLPSNSSDMAAIAAARPVVALSTKVGAASRAPRALGGATIAPVAKTPSLLSRGSRDFSCPLCPGIRRPPLPIRWRLVSPGGPRRAPRAPPPVPRPFAAGAIPQSGFWAGARGPQLCGSDPVRRFQSEKVSSSF